MRKVRDEVAIRERIVSLRFECVFAAASFNVRQILC